MVMPKGSEHYVGLSKLSYMRTHGLATHTKSYEMLAKFL